MQEYKIRPKEKYETTAEWMNQFIGKVIVMPWISMSVKVIAANERLLYLDAVNEEGEDIQISAELLMHQKSIEFYTTKERGDTIE